MAEKLPQTSGECTMVDNGTSEITAASNGTEAAKESPRPRKKEDKSIEHILKALNSLQTPEEKLAALCKKYADLHEEHRLLQGKFKAGTKKLTTVIREKDQLQTEHSKSVLAKSKLESLCRELQRHNKLVKEESLTRARVEEEKRKEVTNKFQSTISEIQAQMNDHYTKNTKLREENLDLANKLKGLIEQYEQREQHIEKVLKHKDLEGQLAEARLQQVNLQLKEEHEKNIVEKQTMIAETCEARKKVAIMEEQEKQLRNQVALYAEKYEEFQSTLAKSNDVFQSFKTEMDKMTKKIKKLEKDTSMWKTRWENSNKALIDMAEDKTRSDKEKVTLNNKVSKLENLCRALQQERNKQTDLTGPALSLSRDSSASPKPDHPTDGDTPPCAPHSTDPDVPLKCENGAPGGDTNGAPGGDSEQHETLPSEVTSDPQTECSSVVGVKEALSGVSLEDRGGSTEGDSVSSQPESLNNSEPSEIPPKDEATENSTEVIDEID